MIPEKVLHIKSRTIWVSTNNFQRTIFTSQNKTIKTNTDSLLKILAIVLY